MAGPRNSGFTKKGDHRSGRAFTKNAVYKLLTNVTYIGKIRYKYETHEGEHDGIVPLDLFRRVRNQLKANGQSGGTGVRHKHKALLKGLTWCKACGRPMTHSYNCKGSKRYRYYVCGTAMQKGWSECPAPSVPAGEIERFVVEQIQTIGTDEDLLNQTIAEILQETCIHRRERDAASLSTLNEPVWSPWLADRKERCERHRLSERSRVSKDSRCGIGWSARIVGTGKAKRSFFVENSRQLAKLNSEKRRERPELTTAFWAPQSNAAIC